MFAGFLQKGGKKEKEEVRYPFINSCITYVPYAFDQSMGGRSVNRRCSMSYRYHTVPVVQGIAGISWH